MRITCPICGTRDRREFTWQGDALALARPASSEWSADWDDYLHNRENPAGPTRDLWYHDACQSWIVADRDTVTHAVARTRLVADVLRSRDRFTWEDGALREVMPDNGSRE